MSEATVFATAYPHTARVLAGDDRWALIDQDSAEFLKLLPDNCIDAVVTDPPAGISFMNAQWDDPQKWDSYGESDRAVFVSWLTRVMRECLRVLKPGGHALVWALPRTSHWTAWALEDAEFEIRDVVTHHYGSGFPKSLDVAKAVAKRAGGPIRAQEAVAFMQDRREELGLSRRDLEVRIFGRSDGNVRNWEDGISIPAPGLWPKIRVALGLESTPFDADLERGDQTCGVVAGSFGYQADGGRWNEDRVLREPVTDLARRWQGWGTALKPASENWILARKPVVGTVAENVLNWGTGALNIDACRIATSEKLTRELGKTTTSPSGWQSTNRSAVAGKDGGRWPANLILTHNDDCELVGTQTVPCSSGHVSGQEPSEKTKSCFGKFKARKPWAPYGDAEEEVVESWRCTPGCPVALLDAQSGESKSRKGSPRKSKVPGDGWGMVNTGAEYDDQGGASRFFFCAKPSRKEKEAGLDALPAQEKDAIYGDGLNSATKVRTEEQAMNGVDRGTTRNVHPTVKGITLCRYLCRLITPSGGIVLDPFAGSGSTGCAALLEGFRFIGIEREPAYCQIAMARIAYWEQQAGQREEP